MAVKKPVAKKGSKEEPVKAVKSAKRVKGDPPAGVGSDVACAVLCYFLVGIIWYFVDEKMRQSSLAKWHAKQGLVLLMAWIVLSVLSMVLMMIPFLGWWIWFVVWLGLLILWILGIVQAASGKEEQLPVLGQFAEMLKF
jgi:uncharacterized membrane protein